MKAEVIHWWTSGGESAAVKVFAEQFAKAGGTWVDTAIAGGVNARTAAINRTVGGTPPDRHAVQHRQAVRRPGRERPAARRRSARHRAEVAEHDAGGDRQCGDAQRQDVTRCRSTSTARTGFGCRTSALAKAGASEPTDWDDVFPALDKLKAAGLIPLAFSGQKVWERNLFNAVLVGKGGNALWVAIYGKRDAAAVKSAGFKAVAETYRQAARLCRSGRPGRNWNDATDLVIQGKAGMQIMGDWAKGEFAAARPDRGQGVRLHHPVQGGRLCDGRRRVRVPEAEGSGTAEGAGRCWPRPCSIPRRRFAFAQKKGRSRCGSIVDVSSLDACAQKAMKLLADKTHQVPAQELLSPPAMTGAIEDVISQYWNTPSMTTDAFVAKIAAVLKDPVLSRRDWSQPARVRSVRDDHRCSLARRRLASRLAAAWRCRRLSLVVARGLCRLHRVDHVDLAHGSRMLPNSTFVGLRQYASLLGNERWQVSVVNLALFGALFLAASLALGFLLAVMIDQRVRAEDLLRSIFLYPFSMSFIVTGLVWQWLLNPSLGIEKMVRDLGLDWFRFDWIVRQDMVIYTLVFAAVWHAVGAGDGDPAGRPARHRPRNLEGGADRRAAAVAGLSLDRDPDAGRKLRHRLGAARDQRGAALRSCRWR